MAVSKISSLLEKQRRVEKTRARCIVIYTCTSFLFLISLLFLLLPLAMGIYGVAEAIKLFAAIAFFVIAWSNWKMARKLREISRSFDRLSALDDVGVSSTPWWKTLFPFS